MTNLERTRNCRIFLNKSMRHTLTKVTPHSNQNIHISTKNLSFSSNITLFSLKPSEQDIRCCAEHARHSNSLFIHLFNTYDRHEANEVERNGKAQGLSSTTILHDSIFYCIGHTRNTEVRIHNGNGQLRLEIERNSEGCMKFLQLNANKSHAAHDDLKLISSDPDIICFQEPAIMAGQARKTANGTTFAYINPTTQANRAPRSSIWVMNDHEAFLMAEFTNRDHTTIKLKTNLGAHKSPETIICSAYLPHKNEDKSYISNPISETLENLCNMCNRENIPLIVCMDSNCHNIAWGNVSDNSRGTKLLEFIQLTNLSILNSSSEPTYVKGKRSSFIDLSITNYLLTDHLTEWRVDTDDSSSDHRRIYFNLNLLIKKPPLTRSVKQTNWSTYKISLGKLTENIEFNECTNHKELDELATTLNSCLRQAYRKACKLKTRKYKTLNNWFNPQLLSLHRERNLAYKEMRKYLNSNQYNDKLDFYKRRNTELSRMIRISKRKTWSELTSNLEKLPEVARMQKLMESSSAPRVGSIQRLSKEFTNDLGESLIELMNTHFPNNKSITRDQQTPDPQVSPLPIALSEERIANLTHINKIKDAIGTLSPHKTPGPDEIIPVMLQKANEKCLKALQVIMQASLKFCYIPYEWREVKVVFIPKAGKSSYDTPKAFRPISLMSFGLKVLEKLIDAEIRNNLTPEKGFSPCQHAYRKGRGTDSAIHDMLGFIEKNLENDKITVACYLDIEGAFDNTTFSIIKQAALEKDIDTGIVNWISAMLENRTITSDLDSTIRFIPTRGCPQGGCLSPLLWSLVIDSLLIELKNSGVKAIGYADDITIAVPASKNLINAGAINMINFSLGIVARWCRRVHLSVNPDKSFYQVFHKPRVKLPELEPVKLFGKQINRACEVKYLGITIDEKLNWKAHIKLAAGKCNRTLFATRKLMTKEWGLNGMQMQWIYRQILIPRMLYGCIAWWHALSIKSNLKILSKSHRQALVLMTGAVRTTPTDALEALTNNIEIGLKAKQLAANTYIRLSNNGLWIHDTAGHSKIAKITKAIIRDLPEDFIKPRSINKKFTTSTASSTLYNRLENSLRCWFCTSYQSENKSAFCATKTKGNKTIARRTSDCATTWQSTLIAITTCATEATLRLSKEDSGKIWIMTDNKAAFDHLRATQTQSKTALDCINHLNKLDQSRNIRIILCIESGHKEWNTYAKTRAASRRFHPNVEVAIPYPALSKRWAIEQHITNTIKSAWNTSTGCSKFAKSNITGYEKAMTQNLLKLKKKDCRVVTGILTGHSCLKKNLKRWALSDTDECRWCHAQPETIEHLLFTCPGTAVESRQLLNNNTNLFNTSYKDIIDFALSIDLYKTFFKDTEPPMN